MQSLIIFFLQRLDTIAYPAKRLQEYILFQLKKFLLEKQGFVVCIASEVIVDEQVGNAVDDLVILHELEVTPI